MVFKSINIQRSFFSMKFGCCVNMLPGVKHLAGAKYFDTLAELGYDYVEIPLNMLSQLSDDEVKQVRAALRSSVMIGIKNCGRTTYIFS